MPTVVIAGSSSAAWLPDVTDWLRASGADPLHYVERAGYVARLADDRAALILIDGAGDDWRFWTTTPKTSPATRRIPVVVITADAARRHDALRSGADAVIAPDDLIDELPVLLTERARVPDAARVAQLQRQCDDPLPPEAQEAVRKFNAGEYYKQHDLFEALWMAEPGPIRDLYRAVLQVGIAYFQITRGNGRGALKMLLRSVQWLALLPDVCQSIDVAQLRADAARVRAELERIGDGDLAGFDRSLLQPVRVIPT